jgi:hypothetical protein
MPEKIKFICEKQNEDEMSKEIRNYLENMINNMTNKHDKYTTESSPLKRVGEQRSTTSWYCLSHSAPWS